MAEARRTFTREFKIAAVKLVTEKGKSVSEAAKSLGIATELLRRWKHALREDADQAFPGHGTLPPAEDELRRLKAEVARLKAERDILKKAWPSRIMGRMNAVDGCAEDVGTRAAMIHLGVTPSATEVDHGPPLFDRLPAHPQGRVPRAP